MSMTRLSAVVLALAAPLTGQVGGSEPAGQEAVDANSRVARVLKAMTQAPSFECRATMTSKASSIQRQLGGGKTSERVVTAVKEGALTAWSKDDGDQVLAHKDGTWVMLDRDGDWIPCRKPEGLAWKSDFLPDPAFLADRLLHLLPKTKWKAAGADMIGDKPVRLYSCTLELDEANHLVRTGAMPEGGGIGGAAGMVVIRAMGGGGGGFAPPEPDRKIELSVYEDPGTKMPLRIVARLFTEGGAMGGMVVRVQGIGGDDEEEEEEKDGKKKPDLTFELELSNIGEAKAGFLGQKPRDVLGGRR